MRTSDASSPLTGDGYNSWSSTLMSTKAFAPARCTARAASTAATLPQTTTATLSRSDVRSVCRSERTSTRHLALACRTAATLAPNRAAAPCSVHRPSTRSVASRRRCRMWSVAVGVAVVDGGPRPSGETPALAA
jgi:hypothetical protein